MRRWYSLLLLFVLFAAADAQSNSSASTEAGRVLTARLLRVFEWVLDAKFTPDQRAGLSRLVDSNSSSGNSADLQTLQQIAKLNEAIDSIPPEKQEAVHAEIQGRILAQLRRQPADPTSRLLLSVYEAAHGGEQPTQISISSNVPTSVQLAGGAMGRRLPGVPAELVGQWIARRGSGSSYYNPNSGSYGAPNGTADSYSFFADGRYEHALLIQNSLYNCTIRLFGRETGRVTVDGQTLDITPGPGTFEYQDNCRPHLNSKKVTHERGQHWQWRVVREGDAVKLCVRDQDGASACYTRQ
jgi:hypothetical protein